MICLDNLVVGISAVKVKDAEGVVFDLLPPNDFSIDDSNVLLVTFSIFPGTVTHPKVVEYQGNLLRFLGGTLSGDLSFTLVTTSRSRDCVLHLGRTNCYPDGQMVVKQSEEEATVQIVIIGDWAIESIEKVMCA